MTDLHPGLPELAALEQMSAADAAEYLLPILVRRWEGGRQAIKLDWLHSVEKTVSSEEGRLVLSEAWQWLLREGLLVPSTNTDLLDPTGCFVPSSAGREAKAPGALSEVRQARALPTDLLHPTVQATALLEFHRGYYGTAISAAFRSVDVRLRQLCPEIPPATRDFARAAFSTSTPGPLADTREDVPPGERDALAHFFAGALGRYRNPTAHRDIDFTAREAVELLILASHLHYLAEAQARE